MPNLQDFNFKENPFAAMTGNAEGGQPAQAAPSAESDTLVPMKAGPEGVPVPANPVDEDPEVDQTLRGKNSTRSISLAKALTALEDYVTSTTDRNDIMMARGIINALAKLMGKDQEEQGSKLGIEEAPAPVSAPPATGGTGLSPEQTNAMMEQLGMNQ